MHAKLFCKTGQLAGASYQINDGATIGKGIENSIQLDAGPISTKHARIFFDKKANSYIIEDFGSRNGTRLDGTRVREKEKLGELHIITFAEKYDFIFQVPQEDIESSSPQPKTKTPSQPITPLPSNVSKKIESQPIQKQKSVPTPAPSPTIVDEKAVAAPALQTEKKSTGKDQIDVGEKTTIENTFGATPTFSTPESKDQQKKEIPQGADKTIIDDGMIAVPAIPLQEQKSHDVKTPVNVQPTIEPTPSPEITFVLEINTLKSGKSIFELHTGENTIGRTSTNDIAIEDNSMSRNHAVITVKYGNVMLKDLDSKNYTFVNKKRITEETEILSGSEITFGVVQATLKRKA